MFRSIVSSVVSVTCSQLRGVEMSVNRGLFVSGILLILTACSVTVPVVAKIGDDILQGSATGRLSGKGDYLVQNIDGLICTGEYDSLDQELTISSHVTCNDGRYGAVIITRNPGLKSGVGQGKLNDGTVFKFAFGSMSTMMMM